MKRISLLHFVVIAFFVPVFLQVLGISISSARKQQADLFDQSIKPFFAENCYLCHNTKTQSGNLNLEQYRTTKEILQAREQWETVLLKLETGEMPPKGMPRPVQSEINNVIYFLEEIFDKADKAMKPNPGRVTARRLNRAEYNNTVRDLLGVQSHPADEFPQDDSGYGFDNIGDVLSMSPVLMEKYFSAAEKTAREAIYGLPPSTPTSVRMRATSKELKYSNTPLLDYDETGLALPGSIHAMHKFPINAEYNIRVTLGGFRPLSSEPMQFALWIDGKQVKVLSFDGEGKATFADDRQDLWGLSLDFRAPVTEGEHWIEVSMLNFYEGLPSRFNGPNPSKRPAPKLPEFKPPTRIRVSPERVEELRKEFEQRQIENKNVNAARINFMEIGGPYNQRKGPTPESLKLVYVCNHFNGKHHSSCARKIIANLAHHAYRRPVARDEINRLITLFQTTVSRGDSYKEGLVTTIQAMLVSPHFLFRIENNSSLGNKSKDIRQLNQHELASRLSYFIWSSMPDAELLRSADTGILRKHLSAQVSRMLKDPKSMALVENFGGQWLELRRLESIKPDHAKFPQYDDYLRMCMQRETELFFRDIILNNRSITSFISADYSYLNERLAKFYGITGVTGADFRRVDLPLEVNRGGILAQASILTVSSYATRTSPVLRGKWILENILNAPPPPPPPGVPNLDESKGVTAASVRKQLEEHRRNTVCSSCHSRMDPLGFGLENFDAIGKWRSKENDQVIDASGKLPDGRFFSGPNELKAIILSDKDKFTEGLSEKLLTYALGRGLERYDKPVIKNIAAKVKSRNYKFSDLITEITQSLPFQYRN